MYNKYIYDNKFDITDFTISTHSLHYYNSMLVIEKRRINKPCGVRNKGKNEIILCKGHWSGKIFSILKPLDSKTCFH